MKYATIILMLLPAFLPAQDLQFQLETDSIPVVMEGWSPFSPWAGGASWSNPAIADLDADGDLDFMIGEYQGNITYFLNFGNPLNPSFELISFQLDSIMVDAYCSPCFRDLDNDGDLDLLISTSWPHVQFWRNIGTAQFADFLLEDSSLVPGPPWCTGPDLIDIDDDGDFDLFGGTLGEVSFFQNMGTSDSFDYVLQTGNFESINVGDRALPDFVDLDADGDYDLFIGERYGKLWYYRNDGDSVNYNFTYVTNFFDSIDVGDYSSPEFADIDGDGDYDMFVGKEANSASLIGDVYFYENIGSAQQAEFQLRAKNYLMLDVTQFAPRPQLVDINGDNAKDLFTGAGSILDYFENTGDSAAAEFVLLEQAYQGITESSIQPYFVDIDADGDYDLFCGASAIPGPPALALYLNQGTARNPDFQLYNSQFITNPNFFVVLIPALVDIDADGDFDLFMFDDMDHFYYYQNIGTPQWPSFVLVTNQWQGIHQFPYPDDNWYGFSFADLDEDLDLDLVIGSPLQDNLYFYRNQGTAQVPQMVLQTETLLPGSFASIYTPYLTDIDSDDDFDLFVGHIMGGILFFRNITGEVSAPPPVESAAGGQAGIQISLGPNPANPITIVSCQLPVPSQISLEIFDISGRKLVELASGFHLPGEYRYVWDASKNASGIYIIRLQTPVESLSGKLTIIK